MKEGARPELPGGWVWTSIKDICDLINGRAFKPDEWSTQGLPIIRIQNLNNIKTDFNYCNFEVEEKYFVSNGQLLFAWSGTPGTSFGAHIWNRGKAVLNQHIFKVEINENNINKIFFMYIINRNIDEYIRKAHGTAGLAHITKNKFENSIIPLPPLPEQHRIVMKIEELFTKLDAGVSVLQKTQAQLKRYRQSVLKAACEGKLVPTEAELAKAEGREYEAADVLLARILKERGEKAGKGKKYKDLKALDMSELPELPEGWMWTRVGEITEKIEKVSPEDEPETEFIYLDISSIDNRHLKIIEPKTYLGKDTPSRARQKVKAGDVLFSTVRTYLKNIAQVPSIYDGQIASTGFSILRPSTEINENFLFYYVQTEQFLNPLTDIQRGTSYPAVRDGDVREQFFPLPPPRRAAPDRCRGRATTLNSGWG